MVQKWRGSLALANLLVDWKIENRLDRSTLESEANSRAARKPRCRSLKTEPVMQYAIPPLIRGGLIEARMISIIRGVCRVEFRL